MGGEGREVRLTGVRRVGVVGVGVVELVETREDVLASMESCVDDPEVCRLTRQGESGVAGSGEREVRGLGDMKL